MPTSQSDLLSLLASLDFDVEAGISLCGGDEDFYCDLIRELCDDVLPGAADALSSPDPARRQAYAHRIKGTLTTLGERTASKKARELEIALRSGLPDQDLSRSLQDDLDRIHRGLAPALGQHG